MPRLLKYWQLSIYKNAMLIRQSCILHSQISLVTTPGAGYPDATLKWAIGMVGLVAGYWLR